MTTYICKCGRRVSKSTNADTTGNRDTENCKGCPYLLPYGADRYVEGQGFVRDILGYECRMSKDIEYATRFCGQIDDKRSCYIASLDFDFLTRVSNWIEVNYPDRELIGSFSMDDIRSVEYVSNGRYRMSIGCAQNKKGIAAKAALLHQFFDASGARLDMTPEEEKAHILAAIEAGKAKAQERKENMDYIISKHEATGRLYAYYKGVFWFWDEHVQKWLLSQFAEDLYQKERPKRWDFGREHLLAQTSDFHQLDDYEVSSDCIEALLRCNPKTAIPAPASAESPEIVDECSEPNCTCSDCKRQDCTCAGGCDAGDRGKCDGEKNCAQDGCTYTAKHQENPTPAAPASPADAGAATQSPSDAALASSAADSLDVCRGCRCLTCGNGDCDTPCGQRPDEAKDCRFDGRLGDICENYTPKEEAQCQKENAPSAVAAATMEKSAARMCEDPDEETQTTPEAASGAAMESLHAQAVLPQNEPAQGIAVDAPSAQAFDYSGLDDQTVADLHLAEREYSSGKKMAEMGLRRMADAVAIAHDALCGELSQLGTTQKHGNRGEDTFRRWCESMRISKSAAYRFLSVSGLFDRSTPTEQKVLEEYASSVLYEASRPSAEPEAVEALKQQQIKTLKEYRELEAKLKAEREARERAEQQLKDAEQAHQTEYEANSALLADEQRRRQAADEARIAAEKKAQQYREIKDAALEDVKLERGKAKEAERRARAAEEDAAGWKQAGLEMQELVDQRDERIRELESGITVEAAAVDQEEIERRANEISEPLVKIINQQNEQIERMASGNTVAAQASVLEQYLGTMKASLLGNASRVEPSCYDVGALDSLARALREFADSIDGIFEDRSEDND